MSAGDSDDDSEAHVSVAGPTSRNSEQPRVSHLGPPNDSSGVAPGEAVPSSERGWNSHRRLRLVAPSRVVSSLLPPTVPASSRAVQAMHFGRFSALSDELAENDVVDSTPSVRVEPGRDPRNLNAGVAVHAFNALAPASESGIVEINSLHTCERTPAHPSLNTHERTETQTHFFAFESGSVG